MKRVIRGVRNEGQDQGQRKWKQWGIKNIAFQLPLPQQRNNNDTIFLFFKKTIAKMSISKKLRDNKNVGKIL